MQRSTHTVTCPQCGAAVQIDSHTRSARDFCPNPSCDFPLFWVKIAAVAIVVMAFAWQLAHSRGLPVVLILLAALGSLGLNGLWINFPATSAMAAVLAFFILRRTRADLHRPDAA